MGKAIRQYSLVRVKEEKRKLFEDYNREGIKYGIIDIVKEDKFVYFGEIPNMPGHCIVVGVETKEFYVGYHLEDFEEIPKEEC